MRRHLDYWIALGLLLTFAGCGLVAAAIVLAVRS